VPLLLLLLLLPRMMLTSCCLLVIAAVGFYCGACWGRPGSNRNQPIP
jgi:hypothetical protein